MLLQCRMGLVTGAVAVLSFIVSRTTLSLFVPVSCVPYGAEIIFRLFLSASLGLGRT